MKTRIPPRCLLKNERTRARNDGLPPLTSPSTTYNRGLSLAIGAVIRTSRETTDG